jgi:hypothetical protein
VRRCYKAEENAAENCDKKELSDTGGNAHNSVEKVIRSLLRAAYCNGFRTSSKQKIGEKNPPHPKRNAHYLEVIYR